MRKFRQSGSRILAVIMAAAMTLTSVPVTALADIVPTVDVTADTISGDDTTSGNEPGGEDPDEIQMVEGGVDISRYGYKLEGEYCQTVGGNNFNSSAVTIVTNEEPAHVAWTKQGWGNAKWKVYIAQPGKYEIKAHMKAEEAGTFVFYFGDTIKMDQNDYEISGAEAIWKSFDSATDNYTDVSLGSEFEILEAGVYYVKLMDTTSDWQSGQLAAKLDYLYFDCKDKYGSDDEPVEDTPEVAAAKKIYLDSSKSTEERIDAVMSVMTTEEKAAQMMQPELNSSPIRASQVKSLGIGSVLSGGGSAPSTGNTAEDWEACVNEFKKAALESRLGIPLIYGVDAVHGHNNIKDAVIFPHNIGLGAAGDAALVEKVGAAAAEEIRATGIQWTFAPTLGIPDSERWGRYYECFGEDADLTAALGAAYVKGFQNKSRTIGETDYPMVAATAKHYIGEGQTLNGTNQGNVVTDDFNALMSEKELLKPYRAAIDAGAYTVMASYNSVNGLKCHENKALLTDLLKGDVDDGLGFKGFVISDYNGVDQVSGASFEEKVANSVNAGVDMIMETDKWRQAMNAIIAGVELEEDDPKYISMDRVDDAVRRILWVKFEMGLFEETIESYEVAQDELLAKFGGDEHRAVAKEAAEKSLTVLKNDKVKDGKTALQLLSSDEIRKITVAGLKANDVGAQCGGWTISWQGGLDANNQPAGSVNTSFTQKVTEGTTILEGFQEKLKDSDIKVNVNGRGTIAEDTDVAVVVVGEDPYSETNGDRTADTLVLPEDDQKVIETALDSASEDTATVLLLMTGRPVAIADYVDDFDAIIEAWLPGSEGGAAIADVLLDSSKEFAATCPVTWSWYPRDLEHKFDEGTNTILFPAGTGLTRDGTSIKTGGQTSIPSEENRPEAPEKDDTTVATPIKYKDGVDVNKSGGILEGEFSNTSGGFANYRNTIGSEVVDGERVGYVEWGDNGDWPNTKWSAYFRQAGTYKIYANINITTGADTTFNFIIDEYGDGSDIDNPVLKNVDATNATNGYEKIEIGEYTVAESGLYRVKWIDRGPSNNGVSALRAKLDYLQFELVPGTEIGDYEGGEEEVAEDPKDETPKMSQGAVISENSVNVWMTSTENSQNQSWYKRPTAMKNQLTQKDALNLTTIDEQEMTTISVNSAETYQTFLGMGTSLEEASVNNFWQLDPAVRQDFIESLVDPARGGMTLFRLTIGTSDFTSRRFYTYYDVENTENLGDDFEPDWENDFSIEKDKEYHIIDTIKMVQAAAKKYGVEDEVKFFASSWTPPGWMKDLSRGVKFNDNALPGEGEFLRGGYLSDDHIDDLAKYYVRFLEEYKKEGITIYGMTLQNEPGEAFNYPSCVMTGEQEAKLAIAVKKELASSSIIKDDVKLWAFDHNCSIANNFVYGSNGITKVDGWAAAIDGIAFHDYGGDLKTMQNILDNYLNQEGSGRTDQTVNLTERSVWGTTGANSIITYLRNSAISYNSWVTMLDSNRGSHQWPGQPDPTMFARAAGSDYDYWATPEFYITGQFSRFIRPGYVRVASDEGSEATVRNVVFMNPETNEMAAVVVNHSENKQNFKFVIDGATQFVGTVPAKNVATFVWTNPTTEDSLKSMIKTMEEEFANLSEDDYDAESLQALKAAIADVKEVAAKTDATEEIADAIAKLAEARKALKPNSLGTLNELIEQLQEAALNKDDYTADSWAEYAKAFNNALTLAGSASKTEASVQAAIKALNEAKDGLKTSNKKLLNELLASLALENLKDSDWTSESWAVYEAALKKAQNIKETASEAEIKTIMDALDAARKGLVKAPTAPVDPKPPVDDPKPPVNDPKPPVVTPPTPTQPVKVKSIKITGEYNNSKKIAAGKSITLKATVNADATEKGVTWSTSNKKYATVNSKGKVTTKKAGAGKTVTITATAKDGSKKKATYKIKIMKAAVKSIKLKASKTSVKAGKSVTIKATVSPTKNVNKTVTWKSSNTKYATVNSKGKVTTKKAGAGKTVTITATAADGSKKKKTIKIKITK